MAFFIAYGFLIFIAPELRIGGYFVKQRITIAAMAILLGAGSAGATEITNLDSMDHTILFDSAGAQHTYLVEAGTTEYIPGQPNGLISLVTARNPKPSRGLVHADGILSGLIAGERTEGIPADTRDVFVIWEDGNINRQMRRMDGQHGK